MFFRNKNIPEIHFGGKKKSVLSSTLRTRNSKSLKIDQVYSNWTIHNWYDRLIHTIFWLQPDTWHTLYWGNDIGSLEKYFTGKVFFSTLRKISNVMMLYAWELFCRTESNYRFFFFEWKFSELVASIVIPLYKIILSCKIL